MATRKEINRSNIESRPFFEYKHNKTHAHLFISVIFIAFHLDPPNQDIIA